MNIGKHDNKLKSLKYESDNSNSNNMSLQDEIDLPQISTIEEKFDDHEWKNEILNNECDVNPNANEILHSSKLISKKKNRLTCDICDRTFVNKITIKRHLQRKHTVQSKSSKCKTTKTSESILCDVCGNEYRNRKRLLIHLKTHQIRQVHRCTICKKEYIDKGAFREHMYHHSGQKPFKCLYGCELSFAHACNRRQHHRSLHEPENHFTCEICGKTLTRKGGYM